MTLPVFSVSVWAATYVVRRGDTLSQIGQAHIPGPVWGVGGSLKRLLGKNPQITKPDLIYPGQKIEVGESLAKTRLSNRTLASASDATQAPNVLSDRGPPSGKMEDGMNQCTKSSALSLPTLEKDYPSQEIVSALDFGFSSLQAQDKGSGTQATLNTSHNIGISAAWVTHWSQGFSSFLAFGLHVVDFESSTNPDKSLTQTSHVLTQISLGGKSQINSRLSARYFVSEGQKLFLHGLSSNQIAVDAVAVPSLTAGLRYLAYSKKSTRLGVDASGSWLGPASTDTYSVRMGSAFSGSVFMTQYFGKSKESSFSLEVGYAQRNQNTTQITLSQSDLYAGIHLSLPLFQSDWGRRRK